MAINQQPANTEDNSDDAGRDVALKRRLSMINQGYR